MIAHADKNGSHEGMKEEVIKSISIELTDPQKQDMQRKTRAGQVIKGRGKM